MTPITIDGRAYLKCEATKNQCNSPLVGFGDAEEDCALYDRQSCMSADCRFAIYMDDTPEFRQWIVLHKLETK